MNATFPCSKCAGEIEFEVSQAGQEVACPHCGEPAMAYIRKPVSAPPPVAKSILKERKSRPTFVGPLFLVLVGIALIVEGCLTESKNGINQVYAAVQYCTGFLLIGAAVIADYLRALLRNQ